MDNQRFVQMLQESELEVRSYSGRGMYGDECVGVICSSEWEVCEKLMAYLADEIESASNDEERSVVIAFQRDVADQIARSLADHMGRDNIIVYWRNLPASLLGEDGDED